MGQVHSIVKPFFKLQPAVYWFDFLTSFSVGLIAYSSVLFLGFFTWAQMAAYVVSVFAFYRSALFIHEIAHFRKQSMQNFTIVWNVLFGIPFMMPSFTYTTHLDHHTRKRFATHHDGEYLPLAVQDPWNLLLYFCQPLFMPILTVLRFMLGRRGLDSSRQSISFDIRQYHSDLFNSRRDPAPKSFSYTRRTPVY